jgi:hypothetical protein
MRPAASCWFGAPSFGHLAAGIAIREVRPACSSSRWAARFGLLRLPVELVDANRTRCRGSTKCKAVLIVKIEFKLVYDLPAACFWVNHPQYEIENYYQ